MGRPSRITKRRSARTQQSNRPRRIPGCQCPREHPDRGCEERGGTYVDSDARPTQYGPRQQSGRPARITTTRNIELDQIQSLVDSNAVGGKNSLFYASPLSPRILSPAEHMTGSERDGEVAHSPSATCLHLLADDSMSNPASTVWGFQMVDGILSINLPGTLATLTKYAEAFIQGVDTSVLLLNPSKGLENLQLVTKLYAGSDCPYRVLMVGDDEAKRWALVIVLLMSAIGAIVFPSSPGEEHHARDLGQQYHLAANAIRPFLRWWAPTELQIEMLNTEFLLRQTRVDRLEGQLFAIQALTPILVRGWDLSTTLSQTSTMCNRIRKALGMGPGRLPEASWQHKTEHVAVAAKAPSISTPLETYQVQQGEIVQPAQPQVSTLPQQTDQPLSNSTTKPSLSSHKMEAPPSQSKSATCSGESPVGWTAVQDPLNDTWVHLKDPA